MEDVEQGRRMRLSQRGAEAADFVHLLLKYGQKAMENDYDQEKNPKGIIELGTAENHLCEDLMEERFSRPDMVTWTADMQFYNVNSGIPRFREAVAEFLTEKFRSPNPLKAESLVIGCGGGCITECLAFALADAGDYILCPTPAYCAFWADVSLRARVKLYDIPLKGRDIQDGSKPFQLTVELVEKYYEKAIKEGCKVRGILICNPSNPVGNVLDQKVLEDILSFCARVKMHVILDEAYGLSVFDEGAEFCSVLSLRHVPDPEGLHVMWTFSKDFGLSGMRCGLVHTWNKDLQRLLFEKYTYYTSLPVMTQYILTTIIKDKDWQNNVYFPTNLERMRNAFRIMKEGLEAAGVKVYPSKSGFFIWADFQEVLHPLTFEAEHAFFKRLIEMEDGGVYIVPGKEFHCSEPGWFRIIFAASEDKLKTALQRIKDLLVAMRSEIARADPAECLKKVECAGKCAAKGEESLEVSLSK